MSMSDVEKDIINNHMSDIPDSDADVFESPVQETPADTQVPSQVQPQAPQPQVPQPQGKLAERPGAQPGTKDLVDPTTGQVVARGGVERRIYERAQRVERDYQKLAREHERLNTQMQAIQHANDIGKQLGLQPQQQTFAMQLMANYVKDPVGTLKFMFTEAKAAGIKVEDITGAQSSIDSEAVARIIESKLAPLLGQVQQSEAQKRAQSQADAEYGAFLEQYPDVVIHDSEIAQLLRRDTKLSLEAAYWRLRSFSNENGMDWSKPLEAQWNARQGGTQQQPQVQTQQQPRNGKKQLPIGRGNAGGAQAADTSQVMAGENDDWKAIIRNTMRDVGMEV